MNELGNRVYGVFWYHRPGEGQLLREFRSLRSALLYKCEMVDKMNDLNLRIMVRVMSEWEPLEEE